MSELADTLVEWIEHEAGGPVVGAERVVGGASREGWRIDVDGAPPLFLRRDVGRAPLSDTALDMRREAKVIEAVGSSGSPVAVPGIVAVHPTEQEVLMERVEGRSDFGRLPDGEKPTLAEAFVDQLAALHRIDTGSIDTSWAFDELSFWEGLYHSWATEPEPVIEFGLRWLREHRPPDRPSVVVHGDAGPGNFLFVAGRITALLDWEMANVGDPMDDLAFICVRSMIQPFVDLPPLVRRWEERSGMAVDPDRFRWSMVLAEMRCLVPMATVTPVGPELGNHLMYTTMHRRVAVEALADAVGIALEPPVVPAVADTDRTPLYQMVLDELREAIVPELDGYTAHRAKSVARVVRHLDAVDRLGPRLAAEDAEDAASLSDEPTDEEQVRYLGRRAARQTALMAPAMGRLADVHLPPIV